MKKEYKILGNYIKPVVGRNGDLGELPLMGLSITKKFIPSIANTIGTDMSTYRIIEKNQFAYGPVTSRNGDKITIALFNDYEKALISQAYIPFEVIDANELDPEYLMMWFRRPEFDRYARFKSHGSAREIFDWDEMCNTLLPVPSITKQREIVKEYNVVQNRITLNQQLIQKLEETAQAIYRRWFVDFEFPDEKGLPYKSNGGEMVWCEELGKEVPKGWEIKVVSDMVDCNASVLSPKDKFKTIEYLDTSSITNNKIEELQILDLMIDEIPSRAKRKVSHNDIIFSTVRPNLKHFGILKNPKSNLIVSTGFAVLKTTYPNVCCELIYLLITNEENLKSLQARAEMSVSTYPSINPEDLLCINFLLPEKEILLKAKEIFKSQFELADTIRKENKSLRNMKDLLLSKLATAVN
jgi:type I restriction enzyme S subunit